MAGFVFNSAIDHVVRGAISFEDDDFKVMLCTSGYEASKNHSVRSDVTNEVVGEGYGRGGVSVSVAIVPDRHRGGISVELGGALWMHATIEARYAVYYRRSGELIAMIDFEENVRAVRGTFSITPSTISFGFA